MDGAPVGPGVGRGLVLRWADGKKVEIPPRTQTSLSVRCAGMPGQQEWSVLLHASTTFSALWSRRSKRIMLLFATQPHLGIASLHSQAVYLFTSCIFNYLIEVWCGLGQRAFESLGRHGWKFDGAVTECVWLNVLWAALLVQIYQGTVLNTIFLVRDISRVLGWACYVRKSGCTRYGCAIRSSQHGVVRFHVGYVNGMRHYQFGSKTSGRYSDAAGWICWLGQMFIK